MVSLSFTLPTHREPYEITCPIQGPTTLSPASPGDSFLIDLIHSPAFQRLKGVHQHGISTVIKHDSLDKGKGKGKREWVNRFDHSVGAALLVRALGASVEEQAAALLHDVAHTSLSHVIDSVFGRVIHEEDKLEYLSKTNLPAIVEAHGFNPLRVFNEDLFSLLERDSPRLCADRLDYALRDAYNFELLSIIEIKWILGEMVDHEGEICCKSVKAALRLSEAYMASDCFAWANPSHSALYHYASLAIREAISLGQLSVPQLWAYEDTQFWGLIAASPHASVRSLAAKVRPTLRATVVDAEELPREGGREGQEFIELRTKVRCIDPTVWGGEGMGWTALSEVDGGFKKRLTRHRMGNGKRWYRIDDGPAPASALRG